MQVTTLWSPPSEFEGISLVAVQQIFDLIRREPPDMPGEFWAPARQTKAQWVGNPIARVIGGDLDVAASVVATWIKNQVLVEHSYHSPSRRKPITGVTLNETKAAEILGPLYTLPDADDSP